MEWIKKKLVWFLLLITGTGIALAAPLLIPEGLETDYVNESQRISGQSIVELEATFREYYGDGIITRSWIENGIQMKENLPLWEAKYNDAKHDVVLARTEVTGKFTYTYCENKQEKGVCKVKDEVSQGSW